MRSVNIGKLAVRPIPKEIMEKVGCTHCQNRPARWEIGEWNFGCSPCFLYGMDLMKKQREAIDDLVSKVEAATGESFERIDGMVCREEDADRIVMGIVMAQRYELTRGLQ